MIDVPKLWISLRERDARKLERTGGTAAYNTMLSSRYGMIRAFKDNREPTTGYCRCFACEKRFTWMEGRAHVCPMEDAFRLFTGRKWQAKSSQERPERVRVNLPEVSQPQRETLGSRATESDVVVINKRQWGELLKRLDRLEKAVKPAGLFGFMRGGRR